MRHLNAFVLLLLAVPTFAQQPLPFPDSAATWTDAYYWVNPFPPPGIYTLGDMQSYCMNGEDTVINAITYTRVERCGGAYKGALRDDAGAVWYVPADSTQEHLLYDFTMQVGQTAEVYFELFQNEGMLGDVTVADIHQDAELGGRKVLQLQSGAEWIEGIGARWGLFTEPWVNVSNYVLRLECMSHGDTILYPSSSAGAGHCDGTQAIHPTTTAEQIRVSPDPTDGLLRCEGLTPGARMQLIAADGRILPVQPTWSGMEATLDLGPYASGMYFLRISTGQAQVVRAVLRR